MCWISTMAGAFLADKTTFYSVELLFRHLVHNVGLPTILLTPGDMQLVCLYVCPSVHLSVSYHVFCRHVQQASKKQYNQQLSA